MFGNINTEGVEKAEDKLGGFKIWPTDIYEFEIKYAYGGKSDGGASYVGLVLSHPTGEYSQQVYVTNKKGEIFYTPKDSDKKVPLPGFTLINDICMIVTGQTLQELGKEMEEKTIKLYDYEAKKAIPKAMPCLVQLHGQKISLAIEQILENKNIKIGEGANAKYEPGPEEQEKNDIVKAFHPEYKMTVNEAEAGSDAEFYEKWLEAKKGKVRKNLKYKGGAAGATAGAPQARATRASGAPAPEAAAAPARKSLFAKK